MGKVKIISATEARNRWFEILNWVNYTKGEVLIKKNNKVFCKISVGAIPPLTSVDEILNKIYGRLAKRKSYFPYEDKKVIRKEESTNDPNKLWRKKS